MKYYFFLLFLSVLLTVLSCKKIEENIAGVFTETKTSIERKTEEKIKATVDQKISETLNSITNSEDVAFTSVFPNAELGLTKDCKGRKFKFPNGSPAYVFQYKADKDQIIAFLEHQKTTDEARSEVKAKKIDGQKIIEKISFLTKFIPENTINTKFIDSLKADRLIEYYKIKRYPNNSTLIYSPKTKKVFHFVEVQK